MLKFVATVVLVAMAAVYGRGWWYLRRVGYPATRWRPALYFLGLVTVGIALVSSVDGLADERFSMHMVQHLLLTMIAAPLVLLGNPLVVVLWGMSVRSRRWLTRPLTRHARFRAALRALTCLPVAWLVYVVDLWLWHMPPLYELALEHEAVHVLEHAAFFITALLFWWPIVRPAPRLRRPVHPGFEILYLLAATAQNTALGMFLTLSERSFYPHYDRTAARLRVSAVNEQAAAGGIMWVSGHMYIVPILLLLYEFARRNADDGHAVLTEPEVDQ